MRQTKSEVSKRSSKKFGYNGLVIQSQDADIF